MNIVDLLKIMNFEKIEEKRLLSKTNLYRKYVNDKGYIYVEVFDGKVEDLGITNDATMFYLNIGNKKSFYKNEVNKDLKTFMSYILYLIKYLGVEKGKDVRSEEFKKLLHIKE